MADVQIEQPGARHGDKRGARQAQYAKETTSLAPKFKNATYIGKNEIQTAGYVVRSCGTDQKHGQPDGIVGVAHPDIRVCQDENDEQTHAHLDNVDVLAEQQEDQNGWDQSQRTVAHPRDDHAKLMSHQAN